MGLEIKDPNVERLAAELAALTGESVEDAVAAALAERLGRMRATDSMSDRTIDLEKVHRILRRMRAGIVEPVPDHADMLYDERGLPK